MSNPKLKKLAINVASFYLTIAIPLLYLYCLYSIASTPNTLSFPLPLIILGIVASFVGIALWALSMLQLRGSFGVLPGKKVRVTTGLYKYYKHPMYLGITLTYLGLGIANQSSYGLLTTLILLLPVLIIRARLEEKSLTD